MVADDVYMYVRMCLRIYKCVCATRVLVSSLPGNVRQRVRRVTGGCHRFWQEKDDGEKEEKQEEKKQEGK